MGGGEKWLQVVPVKVVGALNACLWVDPVAFIRAIRKRAALSVVFIFESVYPLLLYMLIGVSGRICVVDISR